MVDINIAQKTEQFELAKQNYAKAKEAQYAAEQQVYSLKRNAQMYGTDVFTQSKLANYESSLAAAQSNVFLTGAYMDFKGQEKIDECLFSMRSGGLC